MNLFFSNYEFVLIVVLLYKFEILFEFLKMSDEKKVTLKKWVMIYNTFKNHSNTSKSHFHTKYFLSQNESYNTMISDLSCPGSRKI